MQKAQKGSFMGTTSQSITILKPTETGRSIINNNFLFFTKQQNKKKQHTPSFFSTPRMLDTLACEHIGVREQEKDLGCAIFICFVTYCRDITTKPLPTCVPAVP
jgi:hypothetical protein